MAYGYLGVHFFFMISGFVIELTLERTPKAKDFIVARFARLYPAYWVSILVTTAVVLAFGLPNREISLTQWLANLTMLNGFVGIPYVDGVYWSLRVELSFYVLMFCIYFLGGKNRVVLAMAIWLLCECLLVFVPALNDVSLIRRMGTVTALQYADLFVAGIIYLRIYRQEAKAFDIAVLIAAVGLRFYISTVPELIGVAFANIIFLLIVFDKARFLKMKLLVWLGAISYPLYLIHQNVGYVLMRELYAIGVSTWTGIALATLFAIAASTLIHISVEKPARRFIRTAYKAWFNKEQRNTCFVILRSAAAEAGLRLKSKNTLLFAALIVLTAGVCATTLIREGDSCQKDYRVTVIGDSISIYYSDRLSYILEDEACVQHSGKNAQTAKHAVNQFDHLALDPDPDVIVINAGLWDAVAFAPSHLASYEQSVRELMSNARERADKVVWLQTTPVLTHNKQKRKNSDIQALNEVAQRVAAEQGVSWLSVESLFETEPEQMFYKDGVHLNSKGSRAIAQLVAQTIRKDVQTDQE